MKQPFESFTQKLADPHYLSKRLASNAAKARLKSGSMAMTTREFCKGDEPSGPRQKRKAKALLFSTRGPSGGMSGDPSISGWGAMVNRKLRIFTTPPAMIYDAEGKLIAKIVVDPVTGKRTRVTAEEADDEQRRRQVAEFLIAQGRAIRDRLEKAKELNHGDGEVLRVREGDQGLPPCSKQ